ncbi:hybrid-cluster NAD(P)-dependent oxidoreductase [Ferrimonas sediminicola]|uniref:Hybrid-cluster NAD(P)-dependent oxidoreductase n=1 Tax=Ferrimonas sediminicola TaxID=2569538 RepID=A0A4V5NVY8_9GAMM|nr:hybrid-cluster NAD(P)-dependent oxidoreductase [Ferrimonas sediminicola]TKB51581.1 hybrid-cluster NAD(P)-dependent oxidoreductase [Ferrimonas sediminicola]
MQLTCTEIRAETHDVNTYLFESDQPIEFIPGQFLPLQVEIDGQNYSRCYSLASIPGDRRYALTIKRVSGGLISNHLADNAKVGDRFRSLAAGGEFHFQHAREGKLLMLSAGCGITPVYSMLRARLLADPEADIIFVHSARTPADRIFPGQLEQLARDHSNLKLCWVVSEDAESGQHEGLLDARMLLSLATDLRERTILMCGPQGYMDAAHGWFAALGVDPARVFHEAFAPLSGDNGAVPASEGAGHTLSVGDKSVSIDGAQTVLEALEAQGLPIFAACRAGVCGSCKCKGEDDKLERTAVGPLTPQELAQGYFLACASKVTGDMQLTLP